MLKELKVMVKALAVISGDLDSMLAAKMVMDQGIDVTGVCFKSAFFSYERAIKESEKLNIQLKIIDITDEYFKFVKNYAFNHEDLRNICIDCSLMKLSYTFRTLEDIGADFIILAEEYSLRSLSQFQDSGYAKYNLDETSVDDKVLRPLHLKYTSPTVMERRGIIDRERLLKYNENLDEIRVEFAKELGLKEIINYEGNCRLANPLFSSRLTDLFNYNKDCTVNDIKKLI
jgi:tRNA-uridine 2-sulfurtransferase